MSDSGHRANAVRILEDFAPGDAIAVPGWYEITTEGIRDFASEYDPQPIHLDATAAAAGMFGGIVASGWQSASATMRLLVDARPFGATPLIGIGIDALRFIRPVRAGDRLSAEAQVLEVRALRSRPGQGTLRMRITTRDQHGRDILVQDWTMLLPTRGA